MSVLCFWLFANVFVLRTENKKQKKRINFNKQSLQIFFISGVLAMAYSPFLIFVVLDYLLCMISHFCIYASYYCGKLF